MVYLVLYMKNIKMKKINKLENNLGIVFKNKEYLINALTHRSYLNEHKDIKVHNERLEFLGDAVLELIVSDYLFNKFPDRPEGDLTSFRSALVKTESLADTAKKLGVGESLLLSRGEEDTGGRTKDYLLANTFEAIIGAIYIDQGYEKCKEFVYTHLIPKLNDIIKSMSDIDNKTRIQEITQAKYKVTPVYEVIHEEGPDHNKKFTIVVKINNKVIGKGVGKSKQKAQEQAALSGIEYLEKEN